MRFRIGKHVGDDVRVVVEVETQTEAFFLFVLVLVRVRIEVHVEGIVVAIPEQAVVPSRVEHREVQRELTRALQRGPMRVRAAKPFADACAGSRDVRHAPLEVVERRVHPACRPFERWCVAKERACLIAGPFRERRGAPRDGLALSKQRVFGVDEFGEHGELARWVLQVVPSKAKSSYAHPFGPKHRIRQHSGVDVA